MGLSELNAEFLRLNADGGAVAAGQAVTSLELKRFLQRRTDLFRVGNSLEFWPALAVALRGVASSDEYFLD